MSWSIISWCRHVVKAFSMAMKQPWTKCNVSQLLWWSTVVKNRPSEVKLFRRNEKYFVLFYWCQKETFLYNFNHREMQSYPVKILPQCVKVSAYQWNVIGRCTLINRIIYVSLKRRSRKSWICIAYKGTIFSLKN